MLVADRRAHLVRAEAALGQEPRLPALLGPGRREFGAEALAPDLGGAPAPVRVSRVHRRRDRIRRDARFAQTVGDADRSPAPIRMIRDEMLGEAAVIDQAFLAEPLDRFFGGGPCEAARDQALREFAGAVVAAIQQFEGREPGCLRIVLGVERPAYASAASLRRTATGRRTGMSRVRSAASIFAAISGCSMR